MICNILAVLFSAIFICLFQISHSQQLFPDGDLENWTATGNYFNPSNGFLTSLNQLNSINGPITCERTTDAAVGNFAAKLTTKTFGTFLIPGLLASGTFDLNNLSRPFIPGKPFELRPESFNAYYKYESVNGDSGLLYCALTKWNPSTKQRDTVGVGNKVILTSVSSYINETIDIIYRNQEIPDTVNLIFNSSTAASFNNLTSSAGQVNSTLFVDHITYRLSSGLEFPVEAVNKISANPNPVHSYILINTDLKINEIKIYDFNGKLIKILKNINTNPIDLSLLKYGNYILVIIGERNEILSVNKISKI